MSFAYIISPYEVLTLGHLWSYVYFTVKKVWENENEKSDILNFSKYVGETSCNFTPRIKWQMSSAASLRSARSAKTAYFEIL